MGLHELDIKQKVVLYMYLYFQMYNHKEKYSRFYVHMGAFLSPELTSV